MTGLRQALAGYLDLRRGLGFKLARDEKLLEQFIGWLEDRGTTTVTVPRRRGGRRADAAAVGLSRPRRPGRHLLVLLRFPGYSDTRSLACVTGLWPGMTRSRDCRLPG